MRRRTIAELDFPVELGVFGGPAGFRAQGLRSTSRFGGWSRGVFLLNEHGQDSDLPARFMFAKAHHYLVKNEADPESWWAEGNAYAVDGALTPSQARKLVDAGGARDLGDLQFEATGAGAAISQANLDRHLAEQQARAPWLGSPDYDGDYSGALWATDLTGDLGTFPLTIASYPPRLPWLIAARVPAGWSTAGKYLALPFTREHPAPTLDGPAVALAVYFALPREDEKVVADEVVRGEREPVFTLLIGSKAATSVESDSDG